MRAQSVETVEAFQLAGKTVLLEQLYSRLVPYVDFTFAGRDWFVSHGGVLPEQIEQLRREGRCLVPEDVFMFGVQTRHDTYHGVHGYENYPALGSDRVWQIHGHRNVEPYPLEPYPGVINLEQGVSHDKFLGVCWLETDGQVRLMRYRVNA